MELTPLLYNMLLVIAPIVAVGAGLLIGGASGSFNSFLGWLKGTEPFNPRKQAVALIEGFGAGLLAAWIEVQKFGSEPIDDFQFFLACVSIFIMAGGLQNYANKAAGAIANRNEPKTDTPTPS